LKARYNRFTEAVLKAATNQPDNPVEARFEERGPARVLVYSTADRTGTILLALILPDAKAEELDAVLPPGDGNATMIRQMLGKKPMLVIAVAESAK
jgi:hypothetical protein